MLTNCLLICWALICCCNLKDRGPGLNLFSGQTSDKELDDELGLRLKWGVEYRGNSFPTEISVSLSESESDSLRLELKAKNYILHMINIYFHYPRKHIHK